MGELTEEQQAELFQLLQELKTDIENVLQSSSESRRIVDLDQPIGRLSRMDALQQQAMARASHEALKRRLVLIESALRALRLERYGECRNCEEPIGYQRLKARPESPLCLDCQAQMEKR
jgi:DnaK suppressor protein